MKKKKHALYTRLEFNVRGGGDGLLIALEENSEQIPFKIKRVYYIYSVEQGLRRGFHAHKSLKQVLVCLSGRCDVMLDNGEEREVVTLDKPNIGILLDGIVWREMYNFSSSCILLVLASEHYDPNDYVRDYKKFLGLVRK